MRRYFRKFDWFWVAYLVALGWLWYPMWAHSSVPAFRDGFHFYYPQFYWLDQCYRSGEFFPKWNPMEGLGCSVWGQPTWQIFYPLRVLWLLPVFKLPQLYATWIMVHQIVAAQGMRRLAAEYQLSNKAGWLAGVSFSMGCPVLFQYSNMIYLCSAAWVGWALVPISRLLFLEAFMNTLGKAPLHSRFVVRRFFGGMASQAAQLFLPCSMMVLCGDPHSAVNAAIIGFVCLLFGVICFFRSTRMPTMQTHPNGWALPLGWRISSASESAGIRDLSGVGQGRVWLFGRAGLLLRISVFLTILVLVAVQIAAGWNWFRYSSRAKQFISVTDSTSPILAKVLRDDSESPTPKVFDFSISPWSLPSLVWPTIGGFYQPVHSRWVDALESEGRMWVPSLYIGLLPLLLGLKRGCLVLTGRSVGEFSRVEWFLVLLSGLVLLVAMGNYSLVWIVREFFTFLGFTGWVGLLPLDSDGSLYGLMIQCIPGYDRFRYPAKWIVWAAAALSLLAAFQLDRWPLSRSNMIAVRLPSLATGVVCVAILSCCSVLLLLNPEMRPVLSQWLERSYDHLLGSASAVYATQEILFAIHWPIVILSLAGIGMLGLSKQRQVTFVFIVCMVDLCACARHWVATTPEPVPQPWSVNGKSSPSYWANLRLANISEFHRADRPIDQAVQVKLQQAFRVGKLGLLDGARTFHATGPLRPWAVVKIERWLSRQDNLRVDQSELDEVLSHLGVSRRLIRNNSQGFEWIAIDSVRPLCEIVLDTQLPTQQQEKLARDAANVDWQWTSNSNLKVLVSSPSDRSLIIRQFNDRGWTVDCSTMEKCEPQQGELFIRLRLTPGQHVIQLSRKTFF